MASIKVGVALVALTEATLTEATLTDLLRACSQARETIPWVSDAMPEGDMSTQTYIHECFLRGAIRVESPASKIVFEVLLSHSQFDTEGLGYRLRPLER